MGFSGILKSISNDCNRIFYSFHSEWQAIEPEWKDRQRRKFEQTEISPLLKSGSHLIDALSEVYKIVECFERRDFLSP